MSQIKCPNCGAVFEAKEDKCPYCGYINPGGAEAKFLRDLEGKRQELDKVDDEARQEYKDEMKAGGKKALKLVCIVAIAIAVIIGVLLGVDKLIMDNGREIPVAEEMVWEHTAFQEYDELFEAEEYEVLMQRIADDGDEGHEPWNWEHYDEFMEIADELWGE